MSPERVSVGEKGKGHSMLMDRKQKRRGNQQWRVWCEASGGWEYQNRSGEYGRACKVEDSHRDKTEHCREYLSCTEFFVARDWKPVEKLKQRCYVVSFTFFSVCGGQHSSVCNEGFGQRKQAGQKGENCSRQGVTEWVKWPVQCSLGGKIFLDRTNLTELVVAGFGGLTNEVLHGQCVVEEKAEAFDRVRERDCGIVKLKGVDRNRGQFVSCSDEHRFCLFTI